MARVTYGSGVTELAGSIGGVTYQKNASGNIAKLRSNPTVNPTPLQSVYQTELSFIVSHWHNLSSVNKATWDAFAAAHDHTTPWGETKTLNGFQWYISCNKIKLKNSSTCFGAAPTWTAMTPPDAFTIETSATYIRAAWSPDYNGISLLGYISLPLKQSSLKLRRSLFYTKIYVTSPAISNWDFTTEFENLVNVDWATFYASANCYIIIRILDAYLSRGQVSTWASNIVKIG